MKLLEKAFQLVVHISSAQWVIGIGEDTIEVNDAVGLSVDDSRVEGIAHQFYHFCFIVCFFALDKAISMHYDTIAVVCGLDEFCQCFGHFKILDVRGFELHESLDPFCDGSTFAVVDG